MKTKIKTIIMLALFALLSVATTNAEPLGVENATLLNSTRYNDSITPDSINAEAGNVTQISLNSTGVTKTWTGFYGNISGNLILADSAGKNFYDWDLSSPSGQVYASRSDQVSWTGIDCINSTNLANEETYLGKNAADADSVTNTFNVNSHPGFNVGSTSISGCNSTQAYGSGESQSNEFWQILLDDTSDNTVYTTIIEDSGAVGFDDNPWAFQLLVGENGQVGNEASTPYYFYVELN